MREMGDVDLLTRQGEIAIAKRIEEGIRQVILTLADYSIISVELLKYYGRVEAGEMRLSDIISGFNEEDDEVAAANIGSVLHEKKETNGDNDDLLTSNDELDEDGGEEDDEEGGESGPDPERAAAYFGDLRKLLNKTLTAENKYGRDHRTAKRHRAKLADIFVQFKFTPSQVDKLVKKIRMLSAKVREQEKIIWNYCIKKAKMPRKVFITSFTNHEVDENWLPSVLEHGESYSHVLKQFTIEILRANVNYVKSKLITI